MVGVGCHSEVTLSPLLILLLCAVNHIDATAHVLRLVIISWNFKHFKGCAKGRLWSTAQTIAVEKSYTIPPHEKCIPTTEVESPSL